MTDQIPTKPPGPSSRFAIATRLGALKDIATFSDPFGTSARFHIRRRGSRAHKDWLNSWSEGSPVSSAYFEQLAVGESAAVLTEEERKTIAILQPIGSQEVQSLLSIIDRLTDTAASESLYRNAVRSAVESGKTTYRKVIRIGEEKQVEEALFLLAGWDAMPGQDDDGNPIEIGYSLDQARELMLNDTPLEGVGMDELILSVPAWCLTIDEEQKDGADGSTVPRKVIMPGLTLGRAYVLWVHAMSDLISSFREEVMGAAAKNSAPPSEATTSPGGGTKTSDDRTGADDQPADSSQT